MLMSNVIIRRHLPYVSNVDYGGVHHDLDFYALSCGKNTYVNFITQELNKYEYPYPDKTDVYISDVGVYMPSQFCNELNRKYPYMATFSALSRHVGLCNVHINVQNLNRAWDKLREQSDIYIACQWCKVIFGKIVIQKVTVYDRYQSCVDRIPTWSIKPRLLAKGGERAQIRMQKDLYYAAHGKIKNYLLIYINRSTYDTRIFKTMLKNGKAEMEDSF